MIGVFGGWDRTCRNGFATSYWAALGLAAVLDGGKPLWLGLRAKAVSLWHLRLHLRSHGNLRLSFLG